MDPRHATRSSSRFRSTISEGLNMTGRPTVAQYSVFQDEPPGALSAPIIYPFAQEARQIWWTTVTLGLHQVVLIVDWDSAASPLQKVSAGLHCLRKTLIRSSAPLSPSNTRLPRLSRTKTSAPLFMANSTRRRSRRLPSARGLKDRTYRAAS